MARRANTATAVPETPLALTQPREEVARRLRDRIAVGRDLLTQSVHSDEDTERYDSGYRKWTDYNEELLKVLFTTDAVLKEYKFGVGVGALSMRPDWGAGYHRLDVDRQKVSSRITKLESILGKLELYRETTAQTAGAGSVGLSRDPTRVFVVHGHDEAIKQAVARFLEKIELEAIILQEQPDQGLTVIEKFETYASQVGFAVVLLTPDDIGGAAMALDQASRARQNVIFELGYFAGKLGRGRVCLLRKGEIEIPSDLYGVIYTDLDAAEGWKLKLAKELKAAELKFDGDKVFG